jgi:Putative peptidoglycan binding domain
MPLRLRRAAVVLVGAALAATALVPSASAAPATPVVFPAKPKGLTAPVTQPDDLDATPRYSPQVTCNPVMLPGVSRLRDLALATYRQGYDGGITRSCVTGGSSEHKEGRAWDWMLNVNNTGQRNAAANFLGWLTAANGAQARRLGVMYVIYNRKMWRAYDTGRGWTAYSGASPHTDHIHLSFTWAGARGRTSFWTGRASDTDYGPCAVFEGQLAPLSRAANPEPCASPVPSVKRSNRATVLYGATDSRPVRRAQRRLGIDVSGSFDSTTWTAVKRYQRAHDLPVTGVLDQPTWTSLAPRSVTWSVTGARSPRQAARYANRHFSQVPLRRGSAGAAVAFLQTALDLPVADRNGLLARRTAAAVREFKAANGFGPNAVVSTAVWQAIAAAS